MRTLNVAKQICLISLVCLGFWRAAASPDPEIKWQVLETAHFQVIFDSKHYQLALRYAEASELAYTATQSFFSERPEKTVVVIDDSTDLANGFAMGLPYPLITAFPVLPPPMESISDYGNWEKELMMHEFVHILQFEPANGLARPLRSIFGTILRPNMLLPRWYLEGQAVFMETRLSSRGRLRSHNTMAIPRALVESGNLRKETIGRLNEVSIPDGVGGQRPYLLGGLLWTEIARTGKEEALGGLNYDYSKRFPFLLNGPAVDRTGLSFPKLLDKTYTRMETRVNEQIQTIDANGKYPAQLFGPQTGFSNHNPDISPDGKNLLFLSRTHNTDTRLEVVERPDGENRSFKDGIKKTLLSGLAINRAVWMPDSNAILFDKIDPSDRYYFYSDLFIFELGTKKLRRLTRSARAHDAVVSADGKSVVFIQNTAGATRLTGFDLTTKALKVLYESPRAGVRLSQPEFISAKEIIFTEKGDDGIDDFQVLELETNKTRPALVAYRPVSFARMTSEGLTFVSGKSGIDNIYLATRDLSAARPLTNVTTRAMTSELDSKTGELYFARLVEDGPRIHTADKLAWQNPKLTTPTVAPLVDYEWAALPPDPVITFDREPKEYRALPYMRPRYWLPFAYFVPDGAYFSASTSSADPLGKHLYAVQGSFDTLSKKPSFAGQYVNEQTRISYAVFGADINEYVYSGGFIRHSTLASLNAGFFLSRSKTKFRGGLGWDYIRSSFNTATLGENESRTGPRVSISFADVSQKGLEISPEKGGTAVVSHTAYLPDLGNLNYEKSDLATSFYFSRWLPERHALALFVNGTYAPRLRNVFLGQTTSAADYSSPLINNEFVMRGYPTGAFIGRTLINTNLEYRFPISYRYKGFGTAPLFLSRIHGAVFGDVISVDGGYYDRERDRYRRARTNHAYLGYGAEVRFDITGFNYIPAKLILGGYYGADPRAGYGLTPFLGIAL